MTRRKAYIVRHDKRIGARLDTLAYLFDISPQTILNAVTAGKIRPPTEFLGVKLYHVESVEKALFGVGSEGLPGGPPTTEDPYIEVLKNLKIGRPRGRRRQTD